ncbi:unnamed protein product [Allacma fusca]|uniref:Uncharacterized protein n=1 Tax=Allacma fusca TaxID=39272 RepID=A0A8J2KUK5_9HEXA|nr:unnamed protein product [Allacma fusca]
MDLDLGDEDEEATRCSSCMSACRQLTTFFLSHVGLISLVVGYCIIGAFTFEALEYRHELEMKENMTKTREALTHALWKMTVETDVIREETWVTNATARLLSFEREIINAMKKGGWDGNEKNNTLQWTFSGALFYSIVVITTIGTSYIFCTFW